MSYTANTGYFQNAFKNFGKLIAAINYSANDVTAVNQMATGIVAQAFTGASGVVTTEYPNLVSVVTPYTQALNSAASNVNAMATAAETAANNYLTKVIAVDLGLAANTSVAQAAAALATAASGAGAFVQPSGANNYTNSFACWFTEWYGVTLAQNVSYAIQDSWITSTVQAHSTTGV